MSSPIMRDHARPSKHELLSGRHNSVHVLFDINLDHCAVAAAVGLLVGYLAFSGAPAAPAASPHYQKFEVSIPQ